MKKKQFLWSPLTTYFLTIILMFFLTGCEKEAFPEVNTLTLDSEAKAKENTVRINTFYGPAEPFNGGVIRAMVSMNEFGQPTHMGVKISAKALEGIEHVDSEIITLQLPNKAAGLPFDHIDLNWNAHGHEPAGLYNVPHFDAHFYMVSEDYKMGITDPVKAANYPSEEFVPEGYAPPPSFLPVQLVPQMGVHWTHYTESPPFTHTFIFGSYDGEFIFYEPMFTLDYLLNEADGEYFPIAEPQEYMHKGYFYPTNYSIGYDPVKKDYNIILSGMRWID